MCIFVISPFLYQLSFVNHRWKKLLDLMRATAKSALAKHNLGNYNRADFPSVTLGGCGTETLCWHTSFNCACVYKEIKGILQKFKFKTLRMHGFNWKNELVSLPLAVLREQTL